MRGQKFAIATTLLLRSTFSMATEFGNNGTIDCNNTYCLVHRSRSNSRQWGLAKSTEISAELIYAISLRPIRRDVCAPADTVCRLRRFTQVRIGVARTKKSKTANNNEHRNPSCKRDRAWDVFNDVTHTANVGPSEKRDAPKTPRRILVVQLVNAIHFALFRAAKTCLDLSPGVSR